MNPLAFQYGRLGRGKLWVEGPDRRFTQIDDKTLHIILDLNDRFDWELIQKRHGISKQELEDLEKWIRSKDLEAAEPKHGRIERLDRFRTPLDLSGFLYFLALMIVIQALYWEALARHVSLTAPSQIFVIFPIACAGIIFHELGHFLALRPYTRPRLGMTWIFFLPAVFVQSDVLWKLSRSRRVLVNLMGIFADSIFNCLAILWVFLNPSFEPWVTPLLVTQYIRWLIVLNPLFQGDGYWLFSDLFGVVNLKTEGSRDFKRRKVNVFFFYHLARMVFTIVILLSLALMIYHLLEEVLFR
ncbi:MAG: hypothetical protein JW893_05985 [Candidatus Omnitrophica bacterium]|nr:hypothetical protein [Candidatus Omnitrophota bacterium]